MFLWRLAHNSLPMRMNIKRKHVELDTLCPMCLRLDEDGGHLFLKYKKVTAVWREQHLEDIRLMLCDCHDSYQVIKKICSLPTDKRLHVAILLWDWWTARNKTNAGEKQRTAQEVSGFITRHLQDFCSVQQQSIPPSVTDQRWVPPGPGVVKFNMDAAFHQEAEAGDGRVGRLVLDSVEKAGGRGRGQSTE